MSQRPLFQFAEVEAPRRPSPERRRRERHDDHRSRDLETGKAAEHLVCCDLLLKGYNAFLSDQGLPYDIIVDLGSRILRIQVKGTRQPKNPMPNVRLSDGYFFHIRRTGKGGQRIYGENEFDMYALVALDIHAIAYFAADDLRFQTVALRVPGIQYHHDSKTLRQSNLRQCSEFRPRRLVGAMRQSRRMSLIEAIANVGVGFGVALLTQILVFPLFGLTPSLGENFAIGGLFTLTSIARSYALRRAFEAIRAHNANEDCRRRGAEAA